MIRSVSIIVRGKVQGVFFRQSTKDAAKKLGISGTVKNNSDGTVYIVAEGEMNQLEKFISWCKTGPPRADVVGVEVNEMPPLTFSGFNII